MKKLSLFLVALTMILFSCKPEVEKPTVVTKSVGDVTKTSAKVVGQVTAEGGADVTERGVCWSTDGTPTILDYRVKDVEGGLGTYDVVFTDLVPNTRYYVRAYATNEAGTGYGDEKTFVTVDPEDPEGPENPEDPEDPEQPENAPVVITAEVSDITLSSAICGGEVVSGGDAVAIARGVCWSTNQNPTVSDNYTVDGSGIGTYISNLSNLTDNTTYYVRAYATNTNGVTSYGGERSFTTLEKMLPVVVTSKVSGITTNSAVCGGEVTFDGNLVTERGVCWSTSLNPTINNNKTNDGNGIGTYISNLSNLTDNTTYYVRAYATNEAGTNYGEERSFTTLPSSGIINGHEWVDLGLPSGLKWATCNVGASSPEEYGNYYAWGETETKAEYTEENSLTDGKQMSDISGNAQYDVATTNWGGSWRMPTREQMEELVEHCEWEWTQVNGVNGYKFTGPNGNSIFLPAAGYRNGSSLKYAGEIGYYWSSTPDESDSYGAYFLTFRSGYQDVSWFIRDLGLSVRPVIE